MCFLGAQDLPAARLEKEELAAVKVPRYADVCGQGSLVEQSPGGCQAGSLIDFAFHTREHR